jgi:hypothetical protein
MRPSAIPVVLDGVGHQVEQHLLEPLAIGMHVAARDIRRVRAQRDLARRGERTDEIERLAHDVGDGHGFGGEMQDARLDARDIEHFVDERQQVATGLENVVGAFALAGGGRFELDELAESENGVQRCPQLVAHPRQKLALRVARGFRGLACGAQRLLGPPPLADVANHAGHSDQLIARTTGQPRVDFDPPRAIVLREAPYLTAAFGDAPGAVVRMKGFDHRGAQALLGRKAGDLSPSRIEERPAPGRVRPEDYFIDLADDASVALLALSQRFGRRELCAHQRQRENDHGRCHDRQEQPRGPEQMAVVGLQSRAGL